MTRDALLWSALGGLAVVTLLVAVLLRRELGVARRELAALRSLVLGLEARVARIQTTPTTATTGGAGRTAATGSEPAPVEREYVITELGHPAASDPVPVPTDRALFADLVLRETVVKTASLAHGVRRALAPQSRNRIRFEMRQEVRRSRKQRRADLKAAQRQLRAQQRADVDEVAS